jgi:hypothetical protein
LSSAMCTPRSTPAASRMAPPPSAPSLPHRCADRRPRAKLRSSASSGPAGPPDRPSASPSRSRDSRRRAAPAPRA